MGKVNHHSQMKHRLLGMYLSICSRFVKSQRSHEFVVVDMYANDGLSRWSSGDQEWEGSAKIIAKWVSKAGENIVSYSVNSEDIPTLFDFEWIEFDFKNIPVKIGQTYYLVSHTVKTIDNCFAWGGSLYDPYPNGMSYVSDDEGRKWEELEYGDMCFKTYGIDTSPPNKPSITGPTSGKAGTEYDYTFSATDPDADNIYYFVNWGCCDDGDFHEYGPYESGEEVTLSHTWSEQGDYVIEAYTKDINGAESDIAKLEISMPKSKTINNKELFEDGNMGFMLVIGDFTEEETRYTGHFSFMLFIGFVDGEFKFYTVHDEMMILEKSLIQKEILITSKIIIVIVAE